MSQVIGYTTVFCLDKYSSAFHFATYGSDTVLRRLCSICSSTLEFRFCFILQFQSIELHCAYTTVIFLLYQWNIELVFFYTRAILWAKKLHCNDAGDSWRPSSLIGWKACLSAPMQTCSCDETHGNKWERGSATRSWHVIFFTMIPFSGVYATSIFLTNFTSF